MKIKLKFKEETKLKVKEVNEKVLTLPVSNINSVTQTNVIGGLVFAQIYIYIYLKKHFFHVEPL